MKVIRMTTAIIIIANVALAILGLTATAGGLYYMFIDADNNLIKKGDWTMKTFTIKATRIIGGEYQDETTECYKASCMDNAIEKFAIQFLENHEIEKIGTNEYWISGENEVGHRIEYSIGNIQVE